MSHPLLQMIDELKARGLRSFSGTLDGSPVVIEFGPPQERVSVDDKPVVSVDNEACRCGHAGFQHQIGLCLLGCDPEKCIEPDKVQ